MPLTKINIHQPKLRILVAPLDWGLGHATRIIPLVKMLENAGATVLLAADGAIAKLLQTELPGREILPLPGYQIRYGKNGKTFFFKMLVQAPAIIKRIKKENNWLKNIIEEKKINALISDNRFGFYAKNIPSVYITHQLYIETGISKMMNRLAQKIHYRYINNFSECWVPDFEKEGLAGKLSHPKTLPAPPIKYLGPLTRMEKTNESVVEDKLLIILSGPEPMRTIWETNLLEQLKSFSGNVVLVRGLPLNSANQIRETETLKIHHYLATNELSEQIKKATLIISRSGYSTIMDLVALQKKAIIVPTPGQGEQEWLADYLMQQNIFYSCSQQNFQLQQVISTANNFPFKIFEAANISGNKKFIEEWLKKISKA